MKRLVGAFALLLLLALPAAALAAGTASSQAPSLKAQMGGAYVSIAGFSFQPYTAYVPVGGTVSWGNQDGVTHTVSSSAFDSGAIGPGGGFSSEPTTSTTAVAAAASLSVTSGRSPRSAAMSWQIGHQEHSGAPVAMCAESASPNRARAHSCTASASSRPASDAAFPSAPLGPVVTFAAIPPGRAGTGCVARG